MLKHTQTNIKIDKIKPYDRNARLHSSEQISQIMESIKEFGFTNPLIVDSDGNLIAGHGRLEAIKQLNKVDFKDNPILELPCVEVNGLSENQKRALVIADNRIAENSTWDFELLKMEIDDLVNENFDLNLLGFSTDELDNLIVGDDASFWDAQEKGDSFKNPDLIQGEGVELKVILREDNYKRVDALLKSLSKDKEEALMEIVNAFEKQ